MRGIVEMLQQSVVVREVCNGIMFLGAAVLLVIFGRYIIRAWRTGFPFWYRDLTVRAAVAISVLLVGHAIRAFSGWMEFLWIDLGWDPSWWLNTLELFLAATTLIVLGKMLMVYAFVPLRWRWHLTIGATILVITIPILLAMIVSVAAHDQALHEKFYSTWMQPDNPARSCCNMKDCAPVRSVRRTGNRWEAQRDSDGRWLVIPPQKIERNRDSPDGRSHLCSVEGQVFCFVAGEGT